jgi:hypothetical protein
MFLTEEWNALAEMPALKHVYLCVLMSPVFAEARAKKGLHPQYSRTEKTAEMTTWEDSVAREWAYRSRKTGGGVREETEREVLGSRQLTGKSSKSTCSPEIFASFRMYNEKVCCPVYIPRHCY